MYFHVSEVDHAFGSILEPGLFGRFIRQFKYGVYASDVDTFRHVLAEMTLEAVRLALVPDAPSRLNCLFVAETVEFARVFRKTYRPKAKIFIVEPHGSPLEPRRCNYDLITRPRSGAPPYVSYMPAEAIEYWTKPIPDGDFPELLYPGQLRIVGSVE